MEGYTWQESVGSLTASEETNQLNVLQGTES